MKPHVLVITPIDHITGVSELIESFAKVTYLPDPTEREVFEHIKEVNAIFTNPNMSNVYISRDLIDKAESLEVICTASTGTNHIDMQYADAVGLDVISLTEEREVISNISSTAEHAFALMLSGLRRIPQAWDSVRQGEWDYQPFIGRQLDHLVVGIVGYGRLGSMFGSYCRGFDVKTIAHDPFKQITDSWVEQVSNVSNLLSRSDIISLHVHLNADTRGMVDEEWFDTMRDDVTLINTSRGEVVDEAGLIRFLEQNPDAYYATDVLSSEIVGAKSNRLRSWGSESGQVLITPHIGGMTREGQMIAYQHAATMLREFYESN